MVFCYQGEDYFKPVGAALHRSLIFRPRFEYGQIEVAVYAHASGFTRTRPENNHAGLRIYGSDGTRRGACRIEKEFSTAHWAHQNIAIGILHRSGFVRLFASHSIEVCSNNEALP